MRKLVRGLVTSTVALSLMSSPVLADSGQVTKSAEVLPGSAVGPAKVSQTRKEAVRAEDLSKALGASGGPKEASGSVGAQRAENWYDANNTIDRYAWTGLWVYSLRVDGYFHTTGSRIDRYGGKYATGSAAGYLLWQVQTTSASWAIEDSTYGLVMAQGTFTHGVPTPWGSIAIETYTDSVSATATP